MDLTGTDVVEVDVGDDAFDPSTFEVDPRTRIVFRNSGSSDHDVRPAVDGAFEPIAAEDLGPGEAATLVLTETGEYPFYCSIHGTPGHAGTAVVGEGSGVVEPP